MKKKKVIMFSVILLILVIALSYLKLNIYGTVTGLSIVNSTNESQNYLLSPSSLAGLFIFLALLLFILLLKFIKKHERRISSHMSHFDSGQNKKSKHLTHSLK
ncbi:hypothetical protein HYW75_01665 [Candidatus Pacearchaeota archaeon]|nr:hypothetical protein [Candidatus Pacearchaeota archaeon]